MQATCRTPSTRVISSTFEPSSSRADRMTAPVVAFVSSLALGEAGEALVVNVTFSGAVGPNAFGFFSATGYLTDTP